MGTRVTIHQLRYPTEVDNRISAEYLTSGFSYGRENHGEKRLGGGSTGDGGEEEGDCSPGMSRRRSIFRPMEKIWSHLWSSEQRDM